jgi:hypothetical protein
MTSEEEEEEEAAYGKVRTKEKVQATSPCLRIKRRALSGRSVRRDEEAQIASDVGVGQKPLKSRERFVCMCLATCESSR